MKSLDVAYGVRSCSYWTQRSANITSHFETKVKLLTCEMYFGHVGCKWDTQTSGVSHGGEIITPEDCVELTVPGLPGSVCLDHLLHSHTHRKEGQRWDETESSEETQQSLKLFCCFIVKKRNKKSSKQSHKNLWGANWYKFILCGSYTIVRIKILIKIIK